MSIQHSVIPDAQLHPMKGAASAISGQLPVANGSGDTVFTTPFNACGQMYISGNTTATTVTAAADATLATNTDYAQVVAGLTSGSLTNTTFSTDHLVAGKAGTYFYSITGDLSAASTSKTAIKLRVNSSNQTHKTIADTAAGEYIPVSLSGFITLAVNDTISLYVANTAGNVTVRDITVNIVRLGVL